jgi:RES domain-containing protein
MKVTAHPRYRELSLLVQAATALSRAWNGVAYRFVAQGKDNPVEIFSGRGSFSNGGRWNAPGTLRAVYASTTPETATTESLAYFRYYGFREGDAMPRTLVALEFDLNKILDLTDRKVRRRLRILLKEITREDWRKLQDAGKESLTQAIGRAACSAGFEGMIAPSAQVRKGMNIVFFPEKQGTNSIARVYKKRP